MANKGKDLLVKAPVEEPVVDGVEIQAKRLVAIYYYLMAHKPVRMNLNVESLGGIRDILGGRYDKDIEALIQQQKQYSVGIVPEVD